MTTRLTLILAVVVLLVGGSTASASITSATAAADGDGVVTCSSTWDANTYEMAINGFQDRLESGHILGAFVTDTELDPTVKMINSIENDTDFTWTDYHINITMDKDFSIALLAGTLAPADWTTVVAQPTAVGGQFVGTIDYYSGTPVQVGQSLDFGYSISFVGTVHYCQEMTPTPEPATMSLLALGGLALIRRRNRK